MKGGRWQKVSKTRVWNKCAWVCPSVHTNAHAQRFHHRARKPTLSLSKELAKLHRSLQKASCVHLSSILCCSCGSHGTCLFFFFLKKTQLVSVALVSPSERWLNPRIIQLFESHKWPRTRPGTKYLDIPEKWVLINNLLAILDCTLFEL